MSLLQTIDQDSTSYLTVTLLDKDDVAAQPTSATYDVADVISSTKIKDGVALSFSSGVVEITLDVDDAKIVDELNNYERRKVTIHAIYSGTDELHAEYEFRVKNLDWVPAT